LAFNAARDVNSVPETGGSKKYGSSMCPAMKQRGYLSQSVYKASPKDPFGFNSHM
jgi:hypothetical protein